MKNRLTIKAIIFDMDGVVTNTMPYHFEAWANVLKHEGIKVSRYDIYKREGQAGIDTVKEIFAEHKIRVIQKRKEEILKKKERLFKEIVKTKFVKGSRPFLRYLKERGFSVSLVTGTSRTEAKRILHKEVYRLFDVIVTGDEVLNGKPNPYPFLKALDLLEVNKDKTVVIENSPFGIKSAKGAGLLCIAITTSLPKRFLKGADLIFSSINELRGKINFILDGRYD